MPKPSILKNRNAKRKKQHTKLTEKRKKAAYKVDRKTKRKNSIQSRQNNEKKKQYTKQTEKRKEKQYTKLIEKRKEKSKQNRQKCVNRKWRKTNGI